MAPIQAPKVHYTVIVRLPFPRRDFEDPPQVNWDAAKDRKLWKIISRNPKSGDIDWADRAAEFGVTQTFLLQQAAWLYERHLQHVKAQMTKIRTLSTATTPVPSSGAQVPQQPLTSVAMKRLGSGGASRTPSSLSIRRDSPTPRADGSIPGTPRVSATPGAMPPPLSRTPSTNTVTQSRHFLPPSPRQRNARPVATAIQSSGLGRRFENSSATPPLAAAAEATAESSPASSSSSSSSSSDEEIITRSHAFRRPPRFRSQKPSLADIDNEDSDDEDSPTFLPFAQPGAASSTAQQPRYSDPSATLRDAHARLAASRADGQSDDILPTGTHRHRGVAAPGSSNNNKEIDTQQDGTRTPDRKHKGKGKQPAVQEAESSPTSSSASSAAFIGRGNTIRDSTSGLQAAPQPQQQQQLARRQQQQQQQQQQPKGKHHRLETLSPRHRAELARLSPRRRQGSKASTGSAGHTHENSDGTPSMGSSFSDLDDTSITQSALEEALASNLRHGGASRLSNLSHAFRSRYMQ